MIIDNGVDAQTGIHSWTVRFYGNGVADYVTVNNQLPVSGNTLVFDGYGTSISSPKGLWIALVEKAYAEWNQTGKEGRNGQNSYAAIAGGWMANVDAQVLGQNAASYDLSSTSDQQALVAGMTAKMAVTIATDGSGNSGDTLPYGLYGNHAYAIIGYNSTAKTFTLYNPWGVDQPTQALTWAQLQTVTDGFVVANASHTQPIAGSNLHAAVRVGAGPAACRQRAFLRPTGRGHRLRDRQPQRRVFDRGCRGVAQALRGLGNRRPAVFARDGQRGRSSGKSLARRGRRDPGRRRPPAAKRALPAAGVVPP